jgi:transcriptional regulator with XRE-family HTH domain
VAFSDDVAAWLNEALGDEQAEGHVKKVALATSSGISQDTLFRLLRGEGENVKQKTLDKIARSLGIPAPQIGKALLVAQEAEPSPRLLLHRAQGLLQRVDRMLATSPAAGTVASIEAAEQLVEDERRGKAQPTDPPSEATG